MTLPGTPERKTKSVAAENTFTDWLFIRAGRKGTLSISGSWSGTVTLQRRREGEADSAARDVQSLSANYEGNFDAVGDWYWRVGVKTGGYSSGPVVCEIAT